MAVNSIPAHDDTSKHPAFQLKRRQVGKKSHLCEHINYKNMDIVELSIWENNWESPEVL